MWWSGVFARSCVANAGLRWPLTVCACAGKPSLVTAGWRTVKWQFIAAAPFKAANDASQFVGPVFLNYLLGSIGRNDPPGKSYLFAVVMFAGLILGSLAEAQYWQRSMRAGFRLRAALISAVYRCVLSTLLRAMLPRPLL
jgi:hypothetical protein